MKLHRAITLGLMLAIGVGSMVLLLSRALQPGHSPVALLLVLAATAAGGLAMSWQRYGAGRR